MISNVYTNKDKTYIIIDLFQFFDKNNRIFLENGYSTSYQIDNFIRIFDINKLSFKKVGMISDKENVVDFLVNSYNYKKVVNVKELFLSDSFFDVLSNNFGISLERLQNSINSVSKVFSNILNSLGIISFNEVEIIFKIFAYIIINYKDKFYSFRDMFYVRVNLIMLELDKKITIMLDSLYKMLDKLNQLYCNYIFVPSFTSYLLKSDKIFIFSIENLKEFFIKLFNEIVSKSLNKHVNTELEVLFTYKGKIIDKKLKLLFENQKRNINEIINIYNKINNIFL